MKVDMASAEMIHVGTPIYGLVERNRAVHRMLVDGSPSGTGARTAPSPGRRRGGPDDDYSAGR